MLKTELKVTGSDIPIIRAGIGNLILPGLVIWIILGLKLIKGISLGYIGYFFLIVIILFFLREYINTVSKIYFFKDRLEIITSLSRKVILMDEISDIKISSLFPSSNIKLIFKLKKTKLPISCNFVIMKKTNLGDYNQTLKVIQKLFIEYEKAYGTPVKY